MKIVKLGKHFGVQSKYSDSLPAFVDCQKDSESTGENGTQVKLVLLAVEIFAVYAWGAKGTIALHMRHSSTFLRNFNFREDSNWGSHTF